MRQGEASAVLFFLAEMELPRSATKVQIVNCTREQVLTAPIF